MMTHESASNCMHNGDKTPSALPRRDGPTWRAQVIGNVCQEVRPLYDLRAPHAFK